MKRSPFIVSGLVLGALTVLSVVRGADAQTAPAPRLLSVATLAPAGSTWMRGLEAWNRELRRRTNGALGLRIYPGGVQGDEREVVQKIRNHRLDGGAVTAVGLSKSEGLVELPMLEFVIAALWPYWFRKYFIVIYQPYDVFVRLLITQTS